MLNNILSNRYAQIALVFAAFGGLVSDYIGSGYLIAILISFAIIAFAIWDEYKTQKTYLRQNIPIPIVFNISNPADSKSALGALFEILQKEYPDHRDNLKKYFNIIEDDLVFKYNGDIFDEKRFVDFLKIAKHDIKQLEKRTSKNVHYHIVYMGPVANAIATGAIFGTEGITLYQYNKSTDSYALAINISDRSFKEPVDKYQIITKELIGEEFAEKAVVAVELSSHKIAVEKLRKPIIYLKSDIGATMRDPQSFILANKEVFSVINELQQKTDHIKLAYSMPVVNGFLLGMSIQNYWDIELTQYSEGEYKPVIGHLNRIKYYF